MVSANGHLQKNGTLLLLWSKRQDGDDIAVMLFNYLLAVEGTREMLLTDMNVCH